MAHLERDARRRIGEFYLRRTLEGNLLINHPQNFQKIQKRLETETGLVIPCELSNLLGFSDLEWTGVYDALPILMYGSSSRREVPNFKDATATIEVARSSNPTKRIGTRVVKDERIPFHIRIGGITEDRIVALTYDYGSRKLTNVNISVAEKEVPYPPGLRVEQDELFFVLKPSLRIPPPRSYYDTAATITPGMEDEIWKKHPLRNHTKAIICRVSSQSVDFGYDPIYEGKSRVKEAATKLGFYARREDKMVVIGFKKPEAEKKDMPAWELKLPAQLQTAA